MRQLDQLRNAIIVATLDGEITNDEQKFLRRLASQMGVSDMELGHLQRELASSPPKLVVPRGAEGSAVLQKLVDLALADGKVDSREMRVLKRVAGYLQLPEGELEDMLKSTPDAATILELRQKIDHVYRIYHTKGPDAAREALDEIAAHGRVAVMPLLQVLESYRTPDGASSPAEALALKIDVARRLGQLGDVRTVYYLVQQISIGNLEDEVSSPALREACAETIGQIVGVDFRAEAEKSIQQDQQGNGKPGMPGKQPDTDVGRRTVTLARQWWQSTGRRQHSDLSM